MIVLRFFWVALCVISRKPQTHSHSSRHSEDSEFSISLDSGSLYSGSSSHITRDEIVVDTDFINLNEESRVVEKYSLSTLFTHDGMNHSDLEAQYSERIGSCNESVSLYYIAELVKSFPFYVSELCRYLPNKKFVFPEFMKPYLTSFNVRPDGAIGFAVNEHILPILFIEKHSGCGRRSYEDSVSKNISNVVDQFRCLRSFNTKLKKVTGFTFPRLDEDQCVTEVQVWLMWMSFRSV